jgi:hypothetical protein
MVVQSSPAGDVVDVTRHISTRNQRETIRRQDPNLALAADLRDLARWITRHPNLPKVRFATISLRAIADETTDPRGALELVADCLNAGDDYGRAVEHHRRTVDEVGHDPDVYDIVGKFGAVKVIASAHVAELQAQEDLEFVGSDWMPPAILASYDPDEDPHAQQLEQRRKVDAFFDDLGIGRAGKGWY